LHKTERASDLTLLYYRRVSEMLLSDHKPVFAIYSAKAREIRQADYAKMFDFCVWLVFLLLNKDVFGQLC
jgi:hypothetical protein